MTWQLSAALNLIIAACYFAISATVIRGLVLTGQLRSNRLALATAAIFVTCAVHHGSHTVHMLLPLFGADRAHGLAMRGAIAWQMDVWDVIGAGVAIYYLSIRRTYGTLLRTPAMFEDEVRQQTEARVRDVLDSLSEGVVLFRSDGSVESVNPAAGALLNGSVEAMAGRSPSGGLRLIRADGQTLAADAFPVAVTRADGEPQRGVELGMPNGESVDWIEVNTQPLVAKNSEPPYAVVASFRDVSERRAMEAALRHSREEALAASLMKSEFVANMSHEIRTPLNGVVTMSELLLDTPLTDEQRQYAQVGLNSAEALMCVVNDVLDFSKLEAGKLELDEHEISLEAVIGDVCELVCAEASRKGLELAVSIDPAVPDAVIMDGNRLRQVMTNLVSNAVKFTRAGEVVVRVGFAGAADPHERLRFEVSDTGIGIEPTVMPGLFAAFAQADASTTRRYGGTGLGLRIAKQLTELMGGEIGVHSTPGVGSTFSLTLPCVPCPSGRRGDTQSASTMPDLSGTRILIVNDNATSREILERRAAAWGMLTSAADGAETALALLRDAVECGRPYAVAVIDLEMPDADGVELVRVMKANAQLRSTRVLVVSSAASSLNAAETAGAEAGLPKPVRASQLYNSMVGLFTRSPRGPTLERPRDDDRRAHRSVRRVLVAEDNPVNQFAATQILERLGCVVEIANNGREAIEMSARHDYAALFMDCQMPELDGYAATTAIRRRETDGGRETEGGHVPIIAMTAHSMDGDRERCLAAGMDEYLAKPIRTAAVAAMLDHIPTVRAANRSDRSQPDLFDRSTLAEIGDTDTERELIKMFLEQTAQRMTELDAAIATGENEVIYELAHGLKGSSATVGAAHLADLSDSLCEVADGRSTAAADEAYDQLVNAFRDTAAVMSQHLGEFAQ